MGLLLDELNFPIPVPSLGRFFTRNYRRDLRVFLDRNQSCQAVFSAEDRPCCIMRAARLLVTPMYDTPRGLLVRLYVQPPMRESVHPADDDPSFRGDVDRISTSRRLSLKDKEKGPEVSPRPFYPFRGS
ncbi:hypothetical protein [Novosphingobium sp. BL-8H]|uniref:hypothetical protein n=1 Tax=Novosphingobium sp. BL-8H TaxID=3127640 RepID=UPI003757A805